MKVILKDDVANLGHLGDIKEVAAGYARNFLIPRGLVIPATARNVAEVEHERRLIEGRIARRREELKEVAAKIEQAALTFPVRVGEDGKLFGSVTAKAIAEALTEQGMAVERRQLIMDGPLKAAGDVTLRVDLGHGVSAGLKVSVVPEEEEAGTEA
jgi:large subunit ribosomal protein L9